MTSSASNPSKRPDEIRHWVERWMSDPSLPDNAIPASPDDVLWLLDRVRELESALDALWDAAEPYKTYRDGDLTAALNAARAALAAGSHTEGHSAPGADPPARN